MKKKGRSPKEGIPLIFSERRFKCFQKLRRDIEDRGGERDNARVKEKLLNILVPLKSKF